LRTSSTCSLTTCIFLRQRHAQLRRSRRTVTHGFDAYWCGNAGGRRGNAGSLAYLRVSAVWTSHTLVRRLMSSKLRGTLSFHTSPFDDGTSQASHKASNRKRHRSKHGDLCALIRMRPSAHAPSLTVQKYQRVHARRAQTQYCDFHGRFPTDRGREVADALPRLSQTPWWAWGPILSQSRPHPHFNFLVRIPNVHAL